MASCLVGAVVALAGATFLRTDDDSDSSERAATVTSAPSTVSLRTTAISGAASVVAPSIARIVVRIGDRWTSGAATLVDSHGSLVTAASLVTGASQLVVTFDDGRLRNAKIVDTDRASGLAVLHVDATGIQPVRMATAAPTVGETVTLVTGPADDGGAASTVVGHVESIGNQAQTTTTAVDDLVEIDTEILPDRAGGGVADASGRLVGVSLAGDPSDGRGDVVPARVVTRVTDEAASASAAPHAWLGIEAVDLEEAEGARLTKVVADSPAARAGLATGDVVVAIDGRAIHSTADVVSTLAKLAPNARVTIRVLRHGTPHDLTTVLTTKTPG